MASLEDRDERTLRKDRSRDRSFLGIGWASAAALARAGFTVFGTSRRTSGNGPNQVSMLTGDVTNDEAVNGLVSTMLSKTARIDVLVNNAGIGKGA